MQANEITGFGETIALCLQHLCLAIPEIPVPGTVPLYGKYGSALIGKN
jgi:hypothetical protein